MGDPDKLQAPTDQELIANFHVHRTAFETLRQMVREDRSKTWYFSGSDMSRTLGRKRQFAYRILFDEIQPSLEVTSDDESTRFIFARTGLMAFGPDAFKGIEYLPGSADRAGKLVDNLDKPAALPTGNVYLRPIEPHWYIIVQKID
jgi:hypothetical protein